MEYKFWEDGGRPPIVKEIVDKTLGDAKRFKAIEKKIEKFEKYSYEQLKKAKLIEKLKGVNKYKIHEFRIDLPDVIARILFVVHDNTAYFLNFFLKKSNDIKKKYIITAEKRVRLLKDKI